MAWYDKGIQWTQKYNPNKPDLLPLQMEAAEVLGIEAVIQKAKD
jgi:hypothetical protein